MCDIMSLVTEKERFVVHQNKKIYIINTMGTQSDIFRTQRIVLCKLSDYLNGYDTKKTGRIRIRRSVKIYGEEKAGQIVRADCDLKKERAHI